MNIYFKLKTWCFQATNSVSLSSSLFLSFYTYILILNHYSADECATNPCRNNGICRSNGDTFTCQCDINYTGDRCENLGNIISKTLLSHAMYFLILFHEIQFEILYLYFICWILTKHSLKEEQLWRAFFVSTHLNVNSGVAKVIKESGFSLISPWCKPIFRLYTLEYTTFPGSHLIMDEELFNWTSQLACLDPVWLTVQGYLLVAD